MASVDRCVARQLSAAAPLGMAIQEGLAMTSRVLTGLALGLGLIFVASQAVAAPWNPFDPEERYSGGNPPGRGGYYYGTSPIARTTVNYAGNYKPGTIVISTSERRLYLVLGNG